MSNGAGRSRAKIKVFTFDLFARELVEEYELPDSWKPVNALISDDKLQIIATKYEVRREKRQHASIADRYPHLLQEHE